MTQQRSRKPIMNQFRDLNEDDGYHPRSSSPPSSLSVNNSFTHQSSSATMGSWGFDVNRSTNGQTPANNDQHTIMRTTKDYNEQFVDISSVPQKFKLRTPTLTRQRNGNEFSAVDRLVLGPNRTLQADYNPSDESFQQQMIPTNQHKTQTEQELLAWQNRMLERDQQFGNQSPKSINKRNENNSSRSSVRQIPSSIRPASVLSNMSENQHDHHESTIKSARVIKRYIELLYHLQSFYERITDQLYNGNNFLKTNQSIFGNHCRKITEQLQNSKPIWEEKLSYLQNLLNDISSFQSSIIETETTFLQRRSTLINLLQTLSTQKDLDHTHLSIRFDIDRVLHEDKLAIQLQDELSTLLQHQSLLNDFTSLLQWNRSIYSSNEQNRVENVLTLLREQITTTDSYMSHISQQLTELVTNLRSLEKYILSYTNTVPLIDDALVPSQRPSSNRNRSRPYDETDVDSIRTKDSRNTKDNSSKTRSVSMRRFKESDYNFDRDDIRLSTKKNNIHLNTNNSNNNHTSTRLATIKSAKRDYKTPLNSILKPSSNRRKKDFDIDTEIFKSNKVDIPDLDNDDQILTTNERLSKMKKKEEIRKMISKQNIQEINDQDFNDEDFRSSFNHKRFDLQSMLAEEAKETTRQVAGKHYFNKFYERRSIYPNA